MTAYFSKSLRLERRGDVLVPVVAASTLQPDGTMKCIRVTEGQFPLGPDAWDANPRDWGAALADGYEAAPQFNLRHSLEVVGVLDPGYSWPSDQPFLALDEVAMDVHARDMANSFAGCDNPWVADLFPESQDEEGQDVA